MRAQKLLKRRNGERFWEIVNYWAALIYDATEGARGDSLALVITVPGNEGTELAPGTLNAILKKAGLK